MADQTRYNPRIRRLPRFPPAVAAARHDNHRYTRLNPNLNTVKVIGSRDSSGPRRCNATPCCFETSLDTIKVIGSRGSSDDFDPMAAQCHPLLLARSHPPHPCSLPTRDAGAPAAAASPSAFAPPFPRRDASYRRVVTVHSPSTPYPPSLPAGGTIGATVKECNLCVLTFSVEDNHFVIVLALSTAVVRIFCNRGVFHIAVVAELEACVQKIDLNNMDEEMDDKEPAGNSSAKDPAAAENSKEQERESQGDDIELEGEEDILHAEIAKLQDHAAEQDTRIQQQQSLISTLRGELSDQDNKIKYLEVELKNMKHDAREQGHQLARQTSKINDLREAFNALRRETMYRPAPRADPPANSASGRTNPSRSGGAVGDPGPSTQRAAEPSTQAFGSLQFPCLCQNHYPAAADFKAVV
ncbi:unnamed protein product [Closterium sp. Yama58-4]|nr:unnamed protein product [Closterium sp. Yama58-4]